MFSLGFKDFHDCREQDPKNEDLHRQHADILDHTAGNIRPESFAVKYSDPDAVQQQMDQDIDQCL